ncbi:hypothetical protein AX16_001678 [Volvariella volvacea WC 439]|nr:hypothetical protein AX16_001678 [Volvariella volvacea WC 439]
MNSNSMDLNEVTDLQDAWGYTEKKRIREGCISASLGLELRAPDAGSSHSQAAEVELFPQPMSPFPPPGSDAPALGDSYYSQWELSMPPPLPPCSDSALMHPVQAPMLPISAVPAPYVPSQAQVVSASVPQVVFTTPMQTAPGEAPLTSTADTTMFSTIQIPVAYLCDAIGDTLDEGKFYKRPLDAYFTAFGPLVPEADDSDYDTPPPFGVYLNLEDVDALGDWESDTESVF